MSIVDYVKENLDKGYSSRSLRMALKKQGYSEEEIEEAFAKAKKKEPEEYRETLGFYTAVLLLLIWGNTMLTWPSIVAGIIVAAKSTVLVYVIILFAGLSGGWLTAAVMEKVTKKGGFRGFAGIIIPAVPLEVIFGLYASLQKFQESIKWLVESRGAVYVSAFPSAFPSPIVLGLIYYVAFNVFFIISILKLEKKTGLLAYFGAPAVFYGFWFLTNMLLQRMLSAGIV